MWSWWNSLDAASAVNFWARWIGFGLTVSAALCGLLILTSGMRVDSLKARREKLTKDETDKREKDLQGRVASAEKRLKPRQLNRDGFLKALEGQPKASVQILYLRDDPDSLEFAQEIENLLKRAKWDVTARGPIPTANPSNSGQEMPITMTVGGQPSGVTVVAHSLSEEEIEAGQKRLLGKPDWVKTPWTVLCNAFEESMGEGRASSHSSVPEGTLRVVVGPRP